MRLTFNIPIIHSQSQNQDKTSSTKSYDSAKVESSIKGFKDAISKENIMRLVKNKQAGGSPSANRKARAQDKRRIIINKIKLRKKNKGNNR